MRFYYASPACVFCFGHLHVLRSWHRSIDHARKPLLQNVDNHLNGSIWFLQVYYVKDNPRRVYIHNECIFDPIKVKTNADRRNHRSSLWSLNIYCCSIIWWESPYAIVVFHTLLT